jgi:DNA helicase II / ATP-dependent DNA helicase PcrA
VSWSDALTGPHLDIASSNEPVIHVLAGPGTGKTFSMMRRIQRWLETGVSPQRILAVTFTYCGPVIDRYRELRTRVAALDGLTGNGLVDALWPSTVPEVADIRVLAGNLAVENPSPSALLDTLRRDIMQPELPGSEGDVIRIMSLHKSKGLTADVCIVTGCVAGALPTITEEEPAGQDAERYEQRRLFYVAVTRPQRVLVISSSRLIESGLARRSLIDTFGMENGRARMQPSTFIDELGPSCPAAIRSDEWRDAAAFPRRA